MIHASLIPLSLVRADVVLVARLNPNPCVADDAESFLAVINELEAALETRH